MNCLTGKALAAYRSVVQGGDSKEYDEMKDQLLEAMRLGIEQTRRKFWTPSRKLTESPMDILRQLDSSYSRITRDCTSPAELRQEMLIGRLLSLYPPDVADYVYVRHPTNAHQAAQYLQNYLDSHPWRKHNADYSRPKEVSGFGRGTGNGGGDPGYSREHSGRRGQFGKERSKDEWKGKDGGSHKKDSSGVIPICHECGVKGHKRPECPNRVLSVRNPGHTKGKILYGTVGVNPCIMTLDSGADHTVVRADLVTEAEYTGRSCRVGDYFGYFRDVPMAKVWLGIEKEYQLKHEVLVVPRDCPP